MLKTLTAATLAAAAAGVASLTLAAPALAQSPATHYYEQKVTGYHLGGGYPAYGGIVSWSD